jgi:FliI/YscN family ATPase
MLESLLLEQHEPKALYQQYGTVVSYRDPLLYARIPRAFLGERCTIITGDQTRTALVVSFQEDLVALAPLDSFEGVQPGDRVQAHGTTLTVACSKEMIGTVLDAVGNVIDGALPQQIHEERALDTQPLSHLERASSCTPFTTGVQSIDALLTVARGQRLGIFAQPGTGKSTLLSMIAAQTVQGDRSADLTILALVGERGREAHEFITEVLTPETRKRTIVVVSTSDDPPYKRALAPYTATTLAEYFRDQGMHVVLLVDSLTRTARALRDVGISSGEMPIRQGWTPSVYTKLPRLLERAASHARGSITAFYTVLSAGDESQDALSEEIKSILDGHIVLSQSLASLGIYPAIDVGRSISRLAHKVQSVKHREIAQRLTTKITRYFREKDITMLGGTPDAALALLISKQDLLYNFLKQECTSSCSYEASQNNSAILDTQLSLSH